MKRPPASYSPSSTEAVAGGKTETFKCHQRKLASRVVRRPPAPNKSPRPPLAWLGGLFAIVARYLFPNRA